MTNHNQPHKTTTDIEEIVEEYKVKSCTDLEKGGFNIPYEGNYDGAVIKWLTQTLKDYGDAVRGQEKSFLKKLDGFFVNTVCDCGDEWKNCDIHTLVKDRLKSLKGNQ